MKTVYVSIGNSDDKLTQKQWASFYAQVDAMIGLFADQVYGAWVSAPTSQYQNACWCFEINPYAINGKTWKLDQKALQDNLVQLATEYKQESITWAEVPTVEFLLTVHHPATAIIERNEASHDHS